MGLFNTVAPQGVIFREKARRKSRRAIPSDFRTYAPYLSIKGAMKRWHSSNATIHKWYASEGIQPAVQSYLPPPHDIRERGPQSTLKALCEHYGRDAKTVKRWLREAGTHYKIRQPKPLPKPAPRGNTHAPAGYGLIPQRDASLEGRAADHLRRSYPWVYRCTETGAADAKGNFWRAGNAFPLTGNELLERAKRKGFDPDEWMRVAA